MFIYMYSIHGWGSFCFNYCLNSAWHLWRWSVCGTAEVVWKPTPFDHLTNFWCFWPCGHVPNALTRLCVALQITLRFDMHIHNYTEYNEQWNVFSAFNPSKLEQWVASETLAQGSHLTLPAGAGIRTHNLGLPRVSSPTFYPLGHNCPLMPLTILIRLWFSRLVVHLFLPHFFLPLNFLLTCLDTALCEEPGSLAMNVCGFLSLWRVSMIVFWTTVRSAVFPMIV